jgi:thiol-disulfide isomerase/thioredoxin
VRPAHAASVDEHFYFLRGLGPTMMYSIGVAELAILVGFVIGFVPRLTYGLVLLLHAISTLSSFRQYFHPFEGPNILFFAAWSMLGACFALSSLRALDTLCRVSPSVLRGALGKFPLTQRSNTRGNGIFRIVKIKTDCIFGFHTHRLIGCIAIGLICLQPAWALAQVTLVARTPAPNWELTDLNGKLVKFSDFRGKVIILDFWATWCGPCRVEIPHFVELQKQYEDKGLAVIGVSLDEQGPETVKKFVKQIGVNYPIVIGNHKIVEAYGGIDAIPTTFVIDRQGHIVSRHLGYDDKAVFEKEIQPLL